MIDFIIRKTVSRKEIVKKRVSIILIAFLGYVTSQASAPITLPDPATITVDSLCELLKDSSRSAEAVALLESSAHQERLKELINCENRDGYTALMNACLNKNPAACLKLLELRESLCLDIKKVTYGRTALMIAGHNRNPIMCLKLLELINSTDAYMQVIRNSSLSVMVRLCALLQQKKIITDNIKSVSELLLKIYQDITGYDISYKADSDIKTFLEAEKNRLAYVLDALYPARFNDPNLEIAEEVIQYKEDLCGDIFTFERYRQEEEELSEAYRVWIDENSYERLSNYFVYMPYRMNHYATASIAKNVYTEEEQNRIHNIKKVIEALRNRLQTCEKESTAYTTINQELIQHTGELAEIITLKRIHNHNAICSEMRFKARDYNNENMKLYENRNILFGLLDIGKTFFKSIDHLMMVLHILIFVEKNQDKRAILYNCLNALYTEYYSLVLSPKDQKILTLMVRKIDCKDFSNYDYFTYGQNFLSYKKRSYFCIIGNMTCLLHINDITIEYAILMHNKEVVKRLLSNPTTVPNIEWVYLFLREHIHEKKDDPILDEAWWKSIYDALPRKTIIDPLHRLYVN